MFLENVQLLFVGSIWFTYVILATTHSFKLNPDNFNHRMTGYVCSTYEGLSLVGCARKCQRLDLCLSFNHNKLTRTCEMNRLSSTEGTVIVASGWMLSDIADWRQEMAGSCGANSCGIDLECLPAGTGQICHSGCGVAPTVPNATVTTTGYLHNPVGSSTVYECSTGMTVTNLTADMTSICLGSGDWSPPGFQCS